MSTKRTITVRQLRDALKGLSGECELSFRVYSYRPGEVSNITLENPILVGYKKPASKVDHAVISFWRETL